MLLVGGIEGIGNEGASGIGCFGKGECLGEESSDVRTMATGRGRGGGGGCGENGDGAVGDIRGEGSDRRGTCGGARGGASGEPAGAVTALRGRVAVPTDGVVRVHGITEVPGGSLMDLGVSDGVRGCVGCARRLEMTCKRG